jgi:hypothetical protein
MTPHLQMESFDQPSFFEVCAWFHNRKMWTIQIKPKYGFGTSLNKAMILLNDVI